jgi:hypothetical protein
VARRDYSRRGLSPTASTEKTPGEPPPSGQPSREASYAEKALGEAAAVEEAAVANSAAICPPWPSNTPEQGPASSPLCSVKVDGEPQRNAVALVLGVADLAEVKPHGASPELHERAVTQ